MGKGITGKRKNEGQAIKPHKLTGEQKRYLPVKRALDVVLSGGAVVILSPLLLVISLAIKMDSRGPVLFKQKRVGKNKKLFEIWKFRTMYIDTPKDMPTHMLDHPDAYITKVGKVLRRTSLDELPQLFNILRGDMSVIGPRPALWNQYDLVAERNKYGANNILPGLTGWAQINGRDELEIPVKARLDGVYVRKMGFWMDMKCLFGTIGSVLNSDGVVEGGTGELHKKREQTEKKRIPPKDKQFTSTIPRRILITGANSYIGMAVETWLKRCSDMYQIDTLDMRGDGWRSFDFSGYDVVYHVAGIAHADIGNVTEEEKKLYYRVNTDLAVETAQRAKASGVKQFIFMSSMIVYSGCKTEIITADTKPRPQNFYGDSKWRADCGIRALADESFSVVVLRPPMIYGRGSKGNYSVLEKMAAKLPVFPKVKNQRSMLYIDNLCRFVQLMIDNEESGVFFPQNGEYTNTSDMVQMIARAKGHKIIMVPFGNPIMKLVQKLPGKIGNLATKAFGNSVYDMDMSEYKEGYRVKTLSESIRLTEGELR